MFRVQGLEGEGTMGFRGKEAFKALRALLGRLPDAKVSWPEITASPWALEDNFTQPMAVSVVYGPEELGRFFPCPLYIPLKEHPLQLLPKRSRTPKFLNLLSSLKKAQFLVST